MICSRQSTYRKFGLAGSLKKAGLWAHDVPMYVVGERTAEDGEIRGAGGGGKRLIHVDS